MTQQQEKVYINGNFITMDESCPRVDYVVVKDGIIREVGRGGDIDRFKDVEEIVDLEGKTVLPGFADCHMHLINYSHRKEREADLTDVRSAAELVERMKRFIANKKLKPGEWVIGAGWNNENFSDRQLPGRKLLDLISSVHPIKLTRVCYHLHTVNSLALDLAGINKVTGDTEGGRIERDDRGRPTGVLSENAIDRVNECIPRPRDKKLLKDLIIKGCADLAKAGITTVHTDDFSHIGDQKSLVEAYRELDEEGRLPIRVVLQLRAAGPADIDAFLDLGIRPGRILDKLIFGPVKIIADGSLGARTAALTKQYSDQPESRGIMIHDRDYLETTVAKAFDHGFDVAVHAIGDRAYETVLDVYQRHRDAIQVKGLNPSVVHCQIGSKTILERMKSLGITANIQPVFLNSDWKMAKSRVGRKRLEYSYCWRRYMDMGIRCVGSSDAPVESFDPLYGIYSAVTRKDLEGRPEGGWLPEQGLTPKQAVKLFTVNPSHLIRRQNSLATISAGCLADMVVLSEDVLCVPHERIKNIKVLSTIVGGQRV